MFEFFGTICCTTFYEGRKYYFLGIPGNIAISKDPVYESVSILLLDVFWEMSLLFRPSSDNYIHGSI